MVFNSFAFLLFFPIVTILFFLLPHKFRWVLLLAASCFFYMYFRPVYILVIFFTIIVDYFAGILIYRAQGKKRKWFLAMSIVANVGVLAIFKYYNFLDSNVGALANVFHFTNPIPALNILLPIGLSFHTFQAMSYTIEVYRGNCLPERKFNIYSLYVLFYPQLVTGPIERPGNLIHQFYEKKEFDPDRVGRGLQQMCWGLFKKVVIADRISIYVDTVYANVHLYTGVTFWFTSIMFLMQIYCDFSGYSDIAIGAANVMGFTLMQNFKRPFFSRNIAEFWTRWHISLTTWFRDYVYFSLGGSRVSVPRWYFNIMAVFLLSGLWHGASWNFVLWGGTLGACMVLALIFKRQNEAISNAIGIQKRFPTLASAFDMLVVYLIVSFACIFFRAKTFHDALFVIKHLFIFERQKPAFFGTADNFIYSIFGIAILFLVEYSQEFIIKKEVLWQPATPVIRYVFYATVISIFFLIGVFNGGQFLYFQF